MNNLDRAAYFKSLLENFKIEVLKIDIEISTECEECTDDIEDIYHKKASIDEIEKFINKVVREELVDIMYRYIRLHRKDMKEILGDFIADDDGYLDWDDEEDEKVLKKHNWIEKEKGELDDEKKKETKNSTANTPLKKGGTCMARNS